MKTAALLLVALLSTVQTVGWVECCCILICKHQNDPCKDECRDPEPKPETACCEKPASPAPAHDHEPRCAHLEPSTEIATGPVASIPSFFPALILALPPELFQAPERRLGESVSGQVRGSPPPLLHLLYRSLLI